MKFKTQGISPKAVAAVAAAVVTYLLTQQVLDLPSWLDVLLNAAGVGLAAAAAGVGTVQRVSAGRDGEAGYGLVELAVALLLFVVAIVVILRVV